MQDQLTPRRSERHETSDRPRKTRLVVLTLVFVLIAGATVAAARYYRHCSGAGSTSVGAVRFTVPAGASADQIVSRLADAHLINCGGFVGTC